MPDGQLQALLTWVDTEASTSWSTQNRSGRRHATSRDPRVIVLIHSADDPMDWSEVHGQAVSTTDGEAARAYIDFLSRTYTGHDYSAPVGPHGRVILTIAAHKINTPTLLGG